MTQISQHRLAVLPFLLIASFASRRDESHSFYLLAIQEITDRNFRELIDMHPEQKWFVTFYVEVLLE